MCPREYPRECCVRRCTARPGFDGGCCVIPGDFAAGKGVGGDGGAGRGFIYFPFPSRHWGTHSWSGGSASPRHPQGSCWHLPCSPVSPMASGAHLAASGSLARLGVLPHGPERARAGMAAAQARGCGNAGQVRERGEGTRLGSSGPLGWESGTGVVWECGVGAWGVCVVPECGVGSWHRNVCGNTVQERAV